MMKIVMYRRVLMENRTNIKGRLQRARLNSIEQLIIKICLVLLHCQISKSMIRKEARGLVVSQTVNLMKNNRKHQADTITIIFIMEYRTIK